MICNYKMEVNNNTITCLNNTITCLNNTITCYIINKKQLNVETNQQINKYELRKI